MGTHIGRRSGIRVAVAAVALATVLTGCGSDDPAGTDDEPTGGTETSQSPSENPSVPEPEPTPTVDPATGVKLDVDGFTIRAPEGWDQVYDTVIADAAQGKEGTLLFSVGSTGQLSLKEAERYFWGPRKRPPSGYVSQETTVLGGLTAYHYTAVDEYDAQQVVGTWDFGKVVKITLTVKKRIPEQRQLELIESITASYESPRTAG